MTTGVPAAAPQAAVGVHAHLHLVVNSAGRVLLTVDVPAEVGAAALGGGATHAGTPSFWSQIRVARSGMQAAKLSASEAQLHASAAIRSGYLALRAETLCREVVSASASASAEAAHRFLEQATAGVATSSNAEALADIEYLRTTNASTGVGLSRVDAASATEAAAEAAAATLSVKKYAGAAASGALVATKAALSAATLMAVDAAASASTESQQVWRRFQEQCAAFRFNIAADYQQDKSIPNWGKSDQPGPTYFMSKETYYLHLIVSFANGISEGETRFGRNLVYIRSQQCAGSKDCNDTVWTLLDFLAGGMRSRPDPPLFRTGFCADGSQGQAAVAREGPGPPGLQHLAESVSLLSTVQRFRIERPEVELACRAVCIRLGGVVLASLRDGHGSEGQTQTETLGSILALLCTPAAKVKMVTKLAAVPAAVLDASGADAAEITAALQHVKVELLRDASAIIAMALRPLPLFRVVYHAFDSCKGTNLSQFVEGGLSLALIVGELDGWWGFMQVDAVRSRKYSNCRRVRNLESDRN